MSHTPKFLLSETGAGGMAVRCVISKTAAKITRILPLSRKLGLSVNDSGDHMVTKFSNLSLGLARNEEKTERFNIS